MKRLLVIFLGLLLLAGNQLLAQSIDLLNNSTEDGDFSEYTTSQSGIWTGSAGVTIWPSNSSWYADGATGGGGSPRTCIRVHNIEPPTPPATASYYSKYHYLTIMMDERFGTSPNFVNGTSVLWRKLSNLTSGATYTFSFYQRMTHVITGKSINFAITDGVLADGAYTLGTDGNANSFVKQLNGIVTFNTTASTYTQTSYTFTVPEGKTEVYAVFLRSHKTDKTLTGNMRINIDDMSLFKHVQEVQTGETLIVDKDASINSITVSPGAKLTLNNGVSLTATNGIILQNTALGTASFVDERTADNPTAIAGTVEQAITENNRNWYVSVPVSGKVASNITLSGAKVVQRNEAQSRWDDVLAGDGLTPGVGYIAVASASAGTTNWSLGGNLNSGKVEVPVTRSGASSAGFNLLGNPYPSYLNWEQVLNLNATNETLLLPSIWYRTASFNAVQNKYDYTFNTYNSAGRIASPTSTSGYIPPMQAFWVRANAAGTVTFTNAMRSHGDGEVNKLKAPKVNTQKIIRLQIANEQATDETVLYFNPNAQNAFDRYDTEKMFNNIASKPEIYSLAGAEKLVINGLSDVPQNAEFALGYNYSQGGNLKIKVTELLNFDSNTKVYLLDKHENTETELSLETEYAFNTPSTSNNESRFSLLFRAPGVTTGVVNTENIYAQVFVNAANQLTIISPEKCDYAVYNAVGQNIYAGTTASDFASSTITLQAGMYVVRLMSNGKELTSKLLIK